MAALTEAVKDMSIQGAGDGSAEQATARGGGAAGGGGGGGQSTAGGGASTKAKRPSVINQANALKRSMSTCGEIPAPLMTKFDNLVKKSPDEQCEFFLRSFIFGLGDKWKEPVALCKKFKKFLAERGEKEDIDPVQASDFLQHEGQTRTALQRKAELNDVDVNNDDRICLTEYYLLHFKIMILKCYCDRKESTPPWGTGKAPKTGVGIVGVGAKLLEELFNMPEGIPAELQAALDEFFASKRAREKKRKTLEKKAEAGGVKGRAAQHELHAMDAADMTEMNRVEITLGAAKRKAKKNGPGEALQKKTNAEAKKKKDAAQASKDRLKARMAMFEKH